MLGESDDATGRPALDERGCGATRVRLILLALATLLAGCAEPPAPQGDDTPAPGGATSPPAPTATPCAAGTAASATRVEFVDPYWEQENSFSGDLAYAWLQEQHGLRSWTDLRIVAHRDMAWTGQQGFEVVTVDATNESTAWLLTLRYELLSRCVADRPADDAEACAHWGETANATRAAFEGAGGWSSNATGDCRVGGGG